jgi:hypothetical protein
MAQTPRAQTPLMAQRTIDIPRQTGPCQFGEGDSTAAIAPAGASAASAVSRRRTGSASKALLIELLEQRVCGRVSPPEWSENNRLSPCRAGRQAHRDGQLGRDDARAQLPALQSIAPNAASVVKRNSFPPLPVVGSASECFALAPALLEEGVRFQSRLQRLPLKDKGLHCHSPLQSWPKWAAKTCNLPKSTAMRRSSVTKSSRPRPRLAGRRPIAAHSGNSLQSTLETGNSAATWNSRPIIRKIG